MDPNGSGYVAKFGDAPSGSAPITANLDAARTVQGVLFTSANHQYTISGANTLTFDNTGNNAAAYITDTAAARTNTIGTAVALNSHLNVTTSVSDGLLTMSGPISGTGRVLTKLGPGTLRLSATNTYTGGTVINAGTLVVDGRILGDVNLTSSSARLGGHGVVAGNVTGSGTVTPGNSPGILTIGGLTPGSLTFNFEFTANDPDYTNPLNSLNDVLRITNATPFTANLTAANTVNLYLTTTLTPGITNVFRGGFYTDRNSPFNGEITNAIYNVFLNNVPYGAPLYVTTTNIPAFSQNGYVMEFGVLGGTVNLVPEPSVLLLLGVGGAVIWRRRRRKD
jgi:autotransporter-associated beta strand protein